MGRIAFYAPLKSPNHPVPSGERELARNLMQALTLDGVAPILASEFRSFDKHGDTSKQAALLAEATQEAQRLIARGRTEGWRAWLTYHSYYKAPDLLGPTVAQALGIPYLLVEATLASKRLGGPWDAFERKAMEGCKAADVVFCFTERDAVALRAHLEPTQIKSLPPFLPMETLPEQSAPVAPTILMVAMMRAGDKLASFRIAAETLLYMPVDTPWHVEIAGDGPKRDEVTKLMAPFGKRVRFLGQLDREEIAQAYTRASVFLWPGVNEAFGVVYLEAQARGIPVVAEDRPGVNEVVETGGLVPPEHPQALAQQLSRLLGDAEHHKARSGAARTFIEACHLLPAARDRIWGALHPLMKERS